jgi:hypothetical protein
MFYTGRGESRKLRVSWPCKQVRVLWNVYVVLPSSSYPQLDSFLPTLTYWSLTCGYMISIFSLSSAPTPTPDRGGTLGVWLIGGLLASAWGLCDFLTSSFLTSFDAHRLWGVTCMQTFTFLTRRLDGKLWLKSAVSWRRNTPEYSYLNQRS